MNYTKYFEFTISLESKIGSLVFWLKIKRCSSKNCHFICQASKVNKFQI